MTYKPRNETLHDFSYPAEPDKGASWDKIRKVDGKPREPYMGPGLSYRRCPQAETIDQIIAEKPAAQTVDQLCELVVTALTKIHDRRYGHRHTVSAFNAMEMFQKANTEQIETYDQIRQLIKTLKNE